MAGKVEGKESLRRATSGTGLQPMAFSLRELAGVLGVSYYTARELVAQGKIRSKRVGRRILVPLSAVEEFLNAEEKEVSRVRR